jgi:hypothetical protein
MVYWISLGALVSNLLGLGLISAQVMAKGWVQEFTISSTVVTHKVFTFAWVCF